MSHTVTVTRTTTTTTTSAIIINTGFLKTWPGVLKFFELILGVVVVGLVAYYKNTYIKTDVYLFFLLMAVTFLIGTFLLLLSCLVSISTASILPKTIYIFLYHLFAFLLYLIASIVFLIEVDKIRNSNTYEPLFAAGIIGLIISVLYLGNTIFGYRSYKGL
ncbi:CKLF-like MARVEL transmembrane domain-containing protein 8 [Onthophagus taurus]|uniref:CKLF-like MARVEL transmembrane domain-containing protein 8 n=1 Tax=Onthophagus taurus TaxID=166361 RepID=UPI000C206464|nr:uncharacterized protein LOC111425991 [Onthophagus taurus]